MNIQKDFVGLRKVKGFYQALSDQRQERTSIDYMSSNILQLQLSMKYSKKGEDLSNDLRTRDSTADRIVELMSREIQRSFRNVSPEESFQLRLRLIKLGMRFLARGLFFHRDMCLGHLSLDEGSLVVADDLGSSSRATRTATHALNDYHILLKCGIGGISRIHLQQVCRMQSSRSVLYSPWRDVCEGINRVEK
jgi:hypothetical protein